MSENISVTEAAKFIRKRLHLHKALIADGWFLPSQNSPICTIDFLNDVRYERCAMVRYEELNVRPCVNPPTKKKLQQILVDGIYASLEAEAW